MSTLICRQLCAISAAMFFIVAPASAQVLYGSLTGVVTDSGGAVVPNATIKAKNVETAQELSTVTNAVGSYTFSNLAPGTYDVSVNAPGFRTLTRRRVSI